MSKYSRFGLSFPKDFLLRQGATPAFYVAGTSLVPRRRPGGPTPTVVRAPAGTVLPDEAHAIDELSWEWIERSAAFDSEMARKRELYLERQALIEDTRTPEPIRDHLQKALWHDTNLDMLVFSLMKFFDPARSDTDSANYYMEREWRVFHNVRFALEDLSGIIVPRAYIDAVHADLPSYCGPIAPAD
jgi:hypothetical protein